VLKVLSLGAGVQSSTVLLMSCKGELPKLDAAIFADTQWEPPWVYEQLEKLKKECYTAGISFYRVSKGHIKQDALESQVRGKAEEGKRWASLPYRTRQKDGSIGMIRRQCTSEYKIYPIERKLRELIGLKPRQRAPKEPVIEQWFGISRDEISRMRDPKHKWLVYRYPLIFDIPMDRKGCQEWLRSNGYEIPRRSACVACPYHSNAEWREIRQEPEVWKDAVEFDRAIRKCGGTRGDMFVHRDAVPLDEADIDSAEDRGQEVFGFMNECEGMCGV